MEWKGERGGRGGGEEGEKRCEREWGGRGGGEEGEKRCEREGEGREKVWKGGLAFKSAS